MVTMSEQQHKPIKVAFGSVPKDSGTFTFYRNIRPALAARGISLYCVTVGKPQSDLWEEAYVDDGCVRLAERSLSMKRQAQAFTKWCIDNDIDCVMAINSEGILSAIPHLPARMRVLSRCANAFDHGYRITMSGRERLARIVALTPRLRDDLVADYGADPAKIVLIPNGIKASKFEAAAQRKRGTGARLELGFLGRLEHNQKGVMYLPAIVDALKARGVPFRLRIAGKGVDRARLEEAMASHLSEGSVEFVGALTPDEIPQFLGETDIYLFTSHFEGCPNALLEAMMAGCVPVCGLISGITDFLIETGHTGFIEKLGDAEGFADVIARLHEDRPKLAALSQAVGAEARVQYTDEVAANAYSGMIRDVMSEPPPEWTPRPWGAFKPDPNFPGYWRQRIPAGLKTFLRKFR
ncbi:Glycogen synthase [Roseovarius albus]|uniref:Glycogen synthase n=1 Tax=Roseovarius albus TaxID=1247867 RepID=A0A1X6ZR93_9RHOB|nr:glycosyltransferase family 4 protein [Roseovarius albus]SLN59183.1 Glycogen synthase [Roseovarius albus]